MSNRSTIITYIVISLFFCSIDFVTRLSIAEVQFGHKNIVLDATTVNTAFLNNSDKNILNDKLALFDVVAPSPDVKVKKIKKVVQPAINLMPTQQQQMQKGSLHNLFDDKFKYTLIATFDNNGKQFCFLEQEDLLTKAKKKIRLNLGDMLSNYHLTQINNYWIELTQGNRKIQLQLFLIKPHK